jgi:hypothetical protein
MILSKISESLQSIDYVDRYIEIHISNDIRVLVSPVIWGAIHGPISSQLKETIEDGK